MKAITAVCPTGAAVVNGRVSRRTTTSNNGENAEIKMYLSKLKDLVPFMPKNRKLSKLEIIQHVIDYICDLQSELETSPSVVSNFDAAAVLNELQQDERLLTTDHHSNNNNNNNSLISSSSSSVLQAAGIINSSHQQNIRQPLVDRSTPNMILTSSPSISAVNPSILHYQQNSFHHSHTATEKNNYDGNSRS